MTKGAPNQSAGLSAPSVFSALRGLSGVLLFSVVALLPSPVVAQTVSDSGQGEPAALVHPGMDDFALALLERRQPALHENPAGWVEWQQQKLALFKQLGQWQRIIHEDKTMPAELPATYREWLRLRVIEAHLGQGDGETARDLLLPLIWGDNNSDQRVLAELRRLVIVSYLVQGRQGDARSAMLRYEQDYSDAAADPAWATIKARVMIAAGQPDEAVRVALVSDEPGGESLYTLARLKGSAVMDDGLLRESVAALKNMQLDRPLRQELWSAALARALSMEQLPERITALQQLLSVRDISGASITVAADGLWSSYSEHGQQVANRLQLLVGDFTPWFDAASQFQATAPVQAQALYAWLALHAESGETQARGHALFAALLGSQPQGDELLGALYLSASRYGDLRKAPVAVLYQLTDLYRTLLQREIQRHAAPY